MKNMRMRNDNVLVKLVKEQISTIIHQPDNMDTKAPERSLEAMVLAVGPGYYPDVRLKPDRPREDWPNASGSPSPSDTSPAVVRDFIPTQVAVGDRVLLDSGNSGDDIGNDMRIVREVEIAAVFDAV